MRALQVSTGRYHCGRSNCPVLSRGWNGGMLASGRPADDILAELCRGAKALNPSASAAILVLNRERKCLNRAIAPSAPLAFAALLSNIRPIWELVRPLCFLARSLPDERCD
jgi:hypothetical protein